MTWTTRREYLARGGGGATPLADKLTALGFAPTAPARTIIKQPNNLETSFRDATVQAPQLLTDLMLNFWTYGRGHWSWTASSTGAVADGGLVKGAANFCACGGFNDNFAWMATRVLGIEGMRKGNAEDAKGQTWYKGNFVTMPEDVIDSKWVGNVMTHNYPYSALRMFKFTDHYFCNYNGVIFDATGNATHTNTNTMVAFDLELLPADAAREYNGVNGQAFLVKNVSSQFVPRADLNLSVGRWVLVNLGGDTLLENTNNRAFNRCLLTTQTKVGKSEIENMQFHSGRTEKRVRGL